MDHPRNRLIYPFDPEVTYEQHPSDDALLSNRSPQARVLRTRQLALRAHRVLDLPPRTARVVLGAGCAALLLIIVLSLSGNRPETITVDKLLHFTAYAGLAAIFILALRVRYALPALGILVGMSYLIELLQPLNMRARDPLDALANTLGIAIGASVGLVVRLIYGYVRTELSAAQVRREIRRFPAGTTILHAGDVIDRFFIIKRGEVLLYHEQYGTRTALDRLGPGEMFGLLAEIERTPQPVTVIAASDVQVYQIDYDQVIAAVGGPEQPIGVIVQYLATELREASERVAMLQRMQDVQ